MKSFSHIRNRRMGLLKISRIRLFAAVGLAIVVAWLGLALRQPGWRPGDTFLQASYDSLHSISGANPDLTVTSPVVVVYLDLQSYLDKQQDPARAWPREYHAQLLKRLSQARARAVVFDIVFSQAGPNADADASFSTAIQENGRVILASEPNQFTISPDDRPILAKVGRIEPPFARFSSDSVATGIAAFSIDDDGVARRFIAGFAEENVPTLSWAAARWLGLPITKKADAMEAGNNHWIRYYGPPFTIPHESFSRALDPALVAADFFRDKIVFVGGRSSVDQFNVRKDEFRNPFHSWALRSYFMPGVEVHATEMLNLIRQDWLRRSTETEKWLLVVVALLFGGGLIWLRPIPAAFTAFLGIVLALVLALTAFAHGLWFPWLIVSGAQIPLALGSSVLFYSIDWYQARRQYEAAKRVAEAKIREQAALIDKANDAILLQDLQGHVIYANASAERLYGWRFPELQNNGSAADICSPDSAAAATAREDTLSRGEWKGELRQQTRAGKVIIVASRWTLIRHDNGQPKALLLINTDITEKKQLEAQFLRTQRMNTIGTLAGGMAHDLNNALAPILMGTQLLRRKATDAESQRMLEMMEAQTHRSADMVRQVLLFARGHGSEFELLKLGPLVKELEKMVRETFPLNIEIEAFLPGDLWPVRGNPTQLHQVLLNLCVNARDAMPNGGKLSFVLDNVELLAEEAAKFPGAQPGEFVSLLISDTGTGMPPEVKARIFEPFFTTKGDGRGTGIGLATVLRIVKSHNGFLTVESHPGQGTAFEVFLPRAAMDIDTAKSPEIATLPKGNGEWILIVDDEEAVRQLVAEGLQLNGYQTLTAANGAEAVRLFQSGSQNIQLMITDTSMPVMDGLRTIEALRKIRPGFPIILASGEQQAAPESVRLLRKPFSLADVIIAVNQSLK